DSRAAGATLEEAAESLGLTVRTVGAVDRNGLRPDGTIVDDLPQSRELLRGAFEAEIAAENPPLDIGSRGYLFYEVRSITAARDRALEEVRERVLADWRAEEVSRIVAEKAAEIEKK